LRTALWFSVLGLPKSGLILPYTAQSPSILKRIEFKTKKDVYDEIYRILNEPQTKKHGIGQSLFYQLSFFCNPSEYISEWCWDMIQDYHLVNNYNIPLGENLDDINAWRLDSFNVIQNELNNIKAHKVKENGS